MTWLPEIFDSGNDTRVQWPMHAFLDDDARFLLIVPGENAGAQNTDALSFAPDDPFHTQTSSAREAHDHGEQ